MLSPLLRRHTLRINIAQQSSLLRYEARCYISKPSHRRAAVDVTPEIQNGRPSIIAGMVIAKDAKQDLNNDLVTQIKAQSAQYSDSSIDRLTVLLTPLYAQHAFNNKLPADLLTRLNIDQSRVGNLEVLTAVVDRLPAKQGARETAEGIAYLAQKMSLFEDGRHTELQATTPIAGSLTFAVRARGDVHNVHVQLPLAQTIFTTGLSSTLIRRTYETRQDDAGLQMKSEARLESSVIGTELSSPSKFSYSTPLTPMTPCRQVVSSMGNIIRKLSKNTWMNASDLIAAPSTAQEQLAASSELEAAVSDHFKVLGKQPEAVQIWALIVPAGFTSKDPLTTSTLGIDETGIRKLWQDDRDTLSASQSNVSAILPDLLNAGARLCHVLSGGGGWGKKAGLLSLDPDQEYSTRQLRGEQGWDFSFTEDDSVAMKNKALGQIVKRGESVMFFLASSPAKTNSATRSGGSSADLTLTFGALPSSIDEIPMQRDSAASKTAGDAEHIPNTFGFLSEGGLALKVRRNGDVLTQTKLDVPFATVRISSGTAS